MPKEIILLGMTFLINSTCCVAQNQSIKSIVYSKRDSLPIEFVNIAIKNTIRGTYSNELGEFYVYCSPSDSIILSVIGYVSKTCPCKDQSIYLEEEVTLLKEVTITDKVEKSKTVSLGYYDEKRTGSYIGVNAAATYITNERYIEGKLSKIYFLLSKVKFFYSKPRPSFNRLLVRLLIFNVNKLTGEPYIQLVTKSLTKKIEENQKTVMFDVLELNIDFPPEGLFVGIEFLGYYKDNQFIPFSSEDKNRNVQYKPSFAKTTGKSNSWVRTDYNKEWKLFITNPSEIYNFNFGIEINCP